jgi:diaminopimelate decarboxylase
MDSNYHGRALAAEVLVDGDKSALVRRRQRLEETWTGESIPAWLRK